MNGRSPLERMKTKNFKMTLVLLIVSSVSVWFLSSSSPSIHTKNLASKMKIREQVLRVDPMYLRQLGLAAPSLYDDSWAEASGTRKTDLPSEIVPSPKVTTGPPVIATCVKPNLFEEAVVLMKSVHALFPQYKLIVYDLDLSSSEKILLKKYCNSTWNCETRTLMFEKYPSHLKYLDIRSYRPVCIQEMLNTYGAVIWVDDGYYFVGNNLTSSLLKAKETGIQGWPIKDPTSSFTHPKMFQFFHTDQNDYYFQHMIESSHLIIYNTERVATELMLPWVKCALLEECINPPGAQNTGCNYFRKPLFLYTGCHKYDVSALNVILGQVFAMDESPYTATEEVFGSLGEDLLRAENKTRLTYQMRVGPVEKIHI